MYAIEKTINGNEVQIVVDYNGNGRVLHNFKVLCCFDSGEDRVRSFSLAGWKKCPASSPTRIQKGNYVGRPHMTEYLGSWKYEQRIQASFYNSKKNCYYNTPIDWIEKAILLLIEGNTEELTNKIFIS